MLLLLLLRLSKRFLVFLFFEVGGNLFGFESSGGGRSFLGDGGIVSGRRGVFLNHGWGGFDLER